MARILVVDDEPMMVELVRSILEIEGHQVDVANDGSIALARLGAIPAVKPAPLPDLIVLDLVMAGMDGFTVASRLEKNESTRLIPIIILTGKEQMKEFFKSLPNVKAFLQKSNYLKELAPLVTELTKGG